MINEANSDLGHTEMIIHLVGLMTAGPELVFPEFTLPEGSRADILVYRPDHKIVIIECKADFRPREIARSVLKYSPWCHFLTLALNSGDAQLLHATSAGFMRLIARPEVGLLAVDRAQYTTLQAAPGRRMNLVNQEMVERMIHQRKRR
jgi:hypothetical protein